MESDDLLSLIAGPVFCSSLKYFIDILRKKSKRGKFIQARSIRVFSIYGKKLPMSMILLQSLQSIDFWHASAIIGGKFKKLVLDKILKASTIRAMDDKPTNIQNIDVNNPEFYEQVQTEIEFDMARMKKSVEVLLNLRMEAAELEVETAALYHAELWYEMLDIQNDSPENSEGEDYDDTDHTDNAQTT